jgi:predicted transcriptional regulator of viral defense system
MIDNRLQTVLEDHGGIISLSQVKAAGLSHMSVLRLAKSGGLERAAHGVYVLPDEIPDEMYVAQLRRPKTIYSHGTALFLHDLTDRDPIQYSVTVPTGYNTKQLNTDGFKVFSVRREFYETDIVQIPTKFGHTVSTYGLERTICDCVRSRSRMEAEIVTEAVKRYVRRIDKNLNLLMELAGRFGITKILRNYLEVLL